MGLSDVSNYVEQEMRKAKDQEILVLERFLDNVSGDDTVNERVQAHSYAMAMDIPYHKALSFIRGD